MFLEVVFLNSKERKIVGLSLSFSIQIIDFLEELGSSLCSSPNKALIVMTQMSTRRTCCVTG